jgi:hypothetical protein
MGLTLASQQVSAQSRLSSELHELRNWVEVRGQRRMQSFGKQVAVLVGTRVVALVGTQVVGVGVVVVTVHPVWISV